jgi:hypothetical protein
VTTSDLSELFKNCGTHRNRVLTLLLPRIRFENDESYNLKKQKDWRGAGKRDSLLWNAFAELQLNISKH